jgi:uncharacterized membrane protein YfcA
MSQKSKKTFKSLISGAAAGAINGFFGGGGGMILVPLLRRWVKIEDTGAFATSVFIIAPICAVSAVIYLLRTELGIMSALPFMIGGLIGGFVAGRTIMKVPPGLLRKALALLIIYGGIRALLSV